MSSSRTAAAAVAALVLLVVAALGSDALLARAIAHSEALEAGRLARLAEGRDVSEIPIFGASKAGADYDPAVLGARFYNYGLASASPEVTNLLVGIKLRKASRQPIVIDLFQGAFGGVGDARNYLLLADRPEVRALLRRAGTWKWYYAVPGLRFFGSWDWYVKGLLTDRLALTKRIRRGYVEHLDAAPWNEQQFARDVTRRLRQPLRWGLDPDQARDLLALTRRAPDRLFVLVLSPLHRSSLVGATGEARFRADLARLLAAAPNLRVIDLTRMPLPDRAFLNTGHLNERGARLFSAQLRARLGELGVDGDAAPGRARSQAG